MTAQGQQRHRRMGGILAPLMALAVALRVIAAPLVVAAPEPGMIAICSGGQIYYVTLDGTPVDPETAHSDPCPFLGIGLALADAAPEIEAPRRGLRDLSRPILPVAAPSAAPVKANRARAPPLSV